MFQDFNDFNAPRGYSGYSKSNRAVEAEENDRYPASVASKKLGVSLRAFKAYNSPCEWHHTSSHFNHTDYYDISDLLAVKTGETDGMSDEDIESAKILLAKMKKYTPDPVERDLFRANVEFLTWEGTRNHPKAVQHSGKSVLIYKSGNKLTIFLDDNVYVKMECSNGTYYSRVDASELAIKRQFNAYKKQHPQVASNLKISPFKKG